MKYLLFVLACASGQPQQCVEREFALPEVTNATGCHLAGHFRLSEYMRAHPTLTIEQAHCLTQPLEISQAETTVQR